MPDFSPSRTEASQRVLEALTSFGRRSRTSAALVAQACGLQGAQVQLLFALDRAQECRVAGLATHQLVDPSVVSRQVAALERLGLITRRQDPDDGRASLISLTDAGRAKLVEVRRSHLEAVIDSLQDWPVERISRLAGDLDDLVEASAVVYDKLSGSGPATTETKDRP